MSGLMNGSGNFPESLPNASGPRVRALIRDQGTREQGTREVGYPSIHLTDREGAEWMAADAASIGGVR